jgi:hypothetical protein
LAGVRVIIKLGLSRLHFSDGGFVTMQQALHLHRLHSLQDA